VADLERQTEWEAFSATSSEFRAIGPVSVIYDISRAGMHLRATKKKVWLNGGIGGGNDAQVRR
jgi:hypothetical protein